MKKYLILFLLLIICNPIFAQQICFDTRCISSIEDGCVKNDDGHYLIYFDITNLKNIKLIKSTDIGSKEPFNFNKNIEFKVNRKYFLTNKQINGVPVGKYFYFGVNEEGSVTFLMDESFKNLTYVVRSGISPAYSTWYGVRTH